MLQCTSYVVWGSTSLSARSFVSRGILHSFKCMRRPRGLTVGDPVERRHMALSVELGPGIMDNIFDGIQRPLTDIATLSKDVFIPRGVDVPILNPDKQWEFTPGKFKEGMMVGGGDVLGTVFENELLPEHKIMVPPNVSGQVVKVW